MKKGIIILVLLGLTFFPMVSESQTEKIILGFIDQDDFPMTMTNTTGLNFELLKLVEENLGIEFTFVMLPWKRCFFELQQNKINGLIGASFKEERMEYGSYPMTADNKLDNSKRLYDASYSLYKLKGDNLSWNGTEFVNLNNRKIGSILGYSIVDTLKNLKVDVDDGAKTSKQNLDKMIKGRICASVLMTTDTDFVLKTNKSYSEKIEKVDLPVSAKPYFLMLSHQFVKEHPETAEKIWTKIKDLRDSKEYEDKKDAFFSSQTEF
ncbi:MAG: transporter substrate-binding domain-containing protein [Desulfobacterales bacterium]|nr:transporter substrate-binding domain-containing protein [Desulfobacterales bacterium]